MTNKIELAPNLQAAFEQAMRDGIVRTWGDRSPDLATAEPHCLHQRITGDSVSGLLRLVGDTCWVAEVQYEYTFADDLWRVVGPD